MSRKSTHMLEHRKVKETAPTETDNFLPGASSDCSESVSEETQCCSWCPHALLEILLRARSANLLFPWKPFGTQSNTTWPPLHFFLLLNCYTEWESVQKNKRRSQDCFVGKVWVTSLKPFLPEGVSVDESRMPTALPENVECSVPGTCSDCHAMVFFLLMMMKWVCSDHTDRWKSFHTQQETQCSYLGMTEEVALCAPVYSQPVRTDLLVAVHLGT